MKIAIVGAGSLGIVFGAKLAQTGHQIFFLKKAGHHSPPEVVTCAQQKGQTIKAHAAITTLDQLPRMEMASCMAPDIKNLGKSMASPYSAFYWVFGLHNVLSNVEFEPK